MTKKENGTDEANPPENLQSINTIAKSPTEKSADQKTCRMAANTDEYLIIGGSCTDVG